MFWGMCTGALCFGVCARALYVLGYVHGRSMFWGMCTGALCFGVCARALYVFAYVHGRSMFWGMCTYPIVGVNLKNLCHDHHKFVFFIIKRKLKYYN